MAPVQQQGHQSEGDSQFNRLSHVPEDERCCEHGNQCRQRRDLGQECHTQPDGQRNQAGNPVKTQQSAIIGGNTLAALEAIVKREHMPEKSSKAGNGNRSRCSFELADNNNRQQALQHIAE